MSGAEHPSPRLRTSVVATLVLLAVGLVVVVLTREPGSSDRQGQRETAPPAAGTDLDAAAGELVEELELAWADHDRAGFVAAAGPGSRARAWAGRTYDNLVALGVTAVDLRFVATDDTVSVPEGFAAEVEVSWRPGPRSGYAPTTTDETTVTFVFRQRDDLSVVSTGRPGDAFVPAWLLGRLWVVDVAGAQVIGLDGTPGEVVAMTATAARQVEATVTDSRTPLVVVVPDDVAQLNLLVGASGQRLTQIAALSTTADGSSDTGAPVHVALNPAVFAPLGRRGAQVVLTHEATHAMTGATAVPMPLWVAEGFADYVALADVRVPLSTSAGQILDHVAEHGAPRRIPTDEDFATRAHGLGRTYEAAWLVFRLLDERHGDDAVVSFYRRVLAGDPVEPALRAAFGLDLAGLTAQWRDYLERLADDL